jgi:hypothetical protein
MMYERECLYDVQWQEIRVSMLGSWTTVQNVQRNIRQLKHYVKGGLQDYTERHIRCSNYMAAISLGYGNKPQWTEQKQLVTEAQRHFSAGTNAPYGRAFWDWDKVASDLGNASSDFLKACHADLKKRVKTSTKRTGGTQHRPELMKFIELLTAECTSRLIML